MAPRDLDDEDALTTGAAQTDPAGTSLADDAFRWATAEEGRYSGGVDETDDARLHTHATVDNMVEEVDVVLVGDADDLAAALKALDTALEEGEAAAADDPAAVLRAAFNDRAVRRSPARGTSPARPRWRGSGEVLGRRGRRGRRTATSMLARPAAYAAAPRSAPPGRSAYRAAARAYRESTRQT